MRIKDWQDVALGAGLGLPAGACAGVIAAALAGELGAVAPLAGLGILGGGVLGWALGQMGEGGRQDGFARGSESGRAMGRRSTRRSARLTRPSLRRPMRADVAECGISLGRRAKGISRQRLYASLEEVVLAVAPPRTGKTAWLGGPVIDAPGACVVTSTKPDIYQHTAALRSDRGPLCVFNPEGLGGIDSGLRWSPITGCHRPRIAMQRAGYLLAGSPGAAGTEDRNFWEGASFKVLRCFLFAAAVRDRDMAELARWINEPGDRTALRILQNETTTPAGWTEDLSQILDNAPPKTRDSIYLSLSLTFEFMADPALARAVSPEPGARIFNVGRFLAERGTLYLLASERPYGTLAPLFTALTGHIFEAAKHYAGTEPGGRLDPPLMMALDEAALICPVPLERWTSDGGGRGIPLLICVQSPSQLYDRWGTQAGKTIWNNAAVKLIFGGLTVAEHLEELSSLCGERDEVTRTHTSAGEGKRSTSTSTHRVRVMSASDIRMLAPLHALLLHRNIAPVLTRITPVWRRLDVRRAAKAGIELKAWMSATPARTVASEERRERRRGKLAEVVPIRQPDQDEAVGQDAEAAGE